MQMSHCPGVEPGGLRTVRRMLIVSRWVTVMGIACRHVWPGSWTGAPDNPRATSAVSVMIRVISVQLARTVFEAVLLIIRRSFGCRREAPHGLRVTTKAPGDANRMRDSASRAKLSSVCHRQSVTARCGRFPLTIVAGEGRCERWRQPPRN
jgi:hypothetical protein